MGYSLLIGLDLIEESIDRIVQLGVHVQRQVRRSHRCDYFAKLRKLLGSRVGLDEEHRIRQRAVDAFPVKDVIDIVITLKQFDLRDLRQGFVH